MTSIKGREAIVIEPTILVKHLARPCMAALDRAMALPRTELAAMGARGRDWMQADFSWDRIAADMAEVYAWLSAGGPTPGSVRLN